jgi:DNA-binding response OmpR family regulator
MTTKGRIVIVDDEVALAEGLRDGLVAEGFDVVLAHDGDEGFKRCTEPNVDLIVLDIMLPKRNGYKLCADLRSAGISAPILMLTAKTGELDEAEALDTGADDFLTKPFSFVVLLARVRALQRRRQAVDAAGDGRIERGSLIVDVRQRRCWRENVAIDLTARELDLLAAIVHASPDPITKMTLLEQVWGASFEGDPNVVEVYVGYLRRKIDVPFNRSSLQTVRGVGYRFDADR